MALITKEVQAKNVPANTFVYLPKKNLFLFVNNIVHNGNKIEFIFELDFEQEIVYTFLYNEMVSVVADYTIKNSYVEHIKNTI